MKSAGYGLLKLLRLACVALLFAAGASAARAQTPAASKPKADEAVRLHGENTPRSSERAAAKYEEAEAQFLKPIGRAEKSREEPAQFFLRNARAAYARLLRETKRDAEASKVEARLKSLER